MQATYKDVVCKDHQASLKALKKFEFESRLLLRFERTHGSVRKDMTSKYSQACVLLVDSSSKA